MKTTKSIITQIKNIQKIDNMVIETLYMSSKNSYLVLIFLSTFVTVALYPFLKIKILIWYVTILLLILYRGYNTYLFYKNKNKFSMDIWYKKFIFFAITTALIYSALGFYYIHYLDHYHQLFIGTILLGLSGGSAFSLSQDLKLSIIYVFLLMFPMTITLLFLDSMPLHNMMALMFFMYCIAQVVIFYRIHKQSRTISILELDNTLLQTLFKNAPLALFTYNKNLEIVDCNNALVEIFHNDKKNIVGMNLNTLPDSKVIKTFSKAIREGSASYEGEYTSLYGEDFWFSIKTFTFSDNTNNSLFGIAIMENKTKEHNVIQRMEYLVEHDPLTGLHNRRGFKNHMDKLVDDKMHQNYYSLLFYMDLNQFKAINDSMGHVFGDDVLMAVSQRLKKSVDDKCTIYRLGGDEFVVVVSHITQDKKSLDLKAEKYVKQIQSIFIKPYIVNKISLYISGSIGIVYIEPNYKNIEEILRHADLTMYQAKKSYTHIAHYNSSLDKKQKELFLLQHNLTYATKRNQIELYFQPIVKIKDNSLQAAEMLIRWRHPDKGILSPDEFIPLAKKAGILSKITWWLIDKVCQQIAKWKHDGHWKVQYISVNINAIQFLEHGFVETFLKHLNSYGIHTNDILLEITEQSLIDGFIHAQDTIDELKRCGVQCAIDDFGTGYSSLSYLKKLSFHTLKIDRTFVKDIAKNEKEVILMKTILDIAKQFNYNIVVEGIETEKQRKMLSTLDETLNYQGYLYSKPIKADEFTKKFLA